MKMKMFPTIKLAKELVVGDQVLVHQGIWTSWVEIVSIEKDGDIIHAHFKDTTFSYKEDERVALF